MEGGRKGNLAVGLWVGAGREGGRRGWIREVEEERRGGEEKEREW